MIYGRVIGNELRDVPPEYLPIWGQRWSGYRAPHGPSPFSTRIFSADQMSEIGPALTSPAQFEMALTEEDEGEDASSERSRLHSSLSSPPATHRNIMDLTSRPEEPTTRSVHRSPVRPHGSHASESLLHPLVFHHSIPSPSRRASFKDVYAPWDMDPASIQPRVGPSHRRPVLSGQLQYTLPPHSISEWQCTDIALTQSPTYSFRPTTSGCVLQPSQVEDRTKFTPATPPPSGPFAIPLAQQIIGVDGDVDTFWDHELGMTLDPNTAYPRNPTVAEWASTISPNSSPLRTQEQPGPSLSPGMFYQMVSDYHTEPSHSGDNADDFTL